MSQFPNIRTRKQGMFLKQTGWVFLLLLAPAVAQAASVTLLVPPVWLERGEQTVALVPGTSLQAGDTLRTGDEAAVRLEPGDGSTLELDAGSALTVTELAPLRLSLDAGMLRYAGPVGGFTEKLQLLAGRLQVEVNSGELLAGVRAGAGELLLVAGEVRVAAPAVELMALRYSEPRSWYRLDNGRMEQGQLDKEVVQRRIEALRTDGRVDGLSEAGPWVANLISLRDEDVAAGIVDELVAEGYPVRLSPTLVQGRQWHRVRLSGFADEAQARELGNALAQRYGASRAWVYIPD